jgi:transcriptional antiterminator NusG
MSKKWFVVHAYSGFEKSVQRALLERIKRSEMQDLFGQILVPVEEVVEMKNGAKAISERKFFPGYVLVEMDMTDDSWHLVKSTPKVTGFVGGTANRPTPITQREVDAILRQVQEGVEKPRGGTRQGRPVHRFPRQRGRRELREKQAAGVGDDFRPLDTG